MNNQNCKASLRPFFFYNLWCTATFKTSVFSFAILLILLPGHLLAQAVTGIVTDYRGYWKTSYGAHSPFMPNLSHNLLAFTYNGRQYSTGVNDELLHQKGEVFTAADFWCLPVGAITGELTDNTKIGLAALNDGVANGASNPAPENDMVRYLTDGIKGLDIGTCVANLPVGFMNFYVHSINASEIGDGKPDILVTQVADPTGNYYDRYEFTDANGNRVGTYKDIVFTNINIIGEWLGDFYEANRWPMELVAPFIHTKRPIRLWAADLSEFGLNSSNIGIIRNFKINLSGRSDVAFVAYNRNGMGIGVLPVTITSFTAVAQQGSVQLQWKTGTEREANRFVVERSADGIHYTAIGIVKGHGNSNTERNYTFTDSQPLSGVSYYRLKQVDNNTAFAYSKVVSVKRDVSAQVQVYPNPGRGVFTVSHPKAAAAQKLLVYNAYGALVGFKIAAPGTQQTSIGLGHLPAGAYYLTFFQNGALSSAQFCISK